MEIYSEVVSTTEQDSDESIDDPEESFSVYGSNEAEANCVLVSSSDTVLISSIITPPSSPPSLVTSTTSCPDGTTPETLIAENTDLQVECTRTNGQNANASQRLESVSESEELDDQIDGQNRNLDNDWEESSEQESEQESCGDEQASALKEVKNYPKAYNWIDENGRRCWVTKAQLCALRIMKKRGNDMENCEDLFDSAEQERLAFEREIEEEADDIFPSLLEGLNMHESVEWKLPCDEST